MKSLVKSFVLALVLLIAVAKAGVAEAQTLVLYHADGSSTDVELYTKPIVSFQDGKVLITSPVLNMEYPKEEILRFTYTGGAATGISSPCDSTDYAIRENQLVFHNINPTDKVALYKANGLRVPVRLMHSDNDAVLALSQIPQGVYLLSINGRTTKFTRP